MPTVRRQFLRCYRACCAARRACFIIACTHSTAVTRSTFDALAAGTARRWLPELRFISHYHDHPAYRAVAQHSRIACSTAGQICSYPGVPQRYLDEGDPYHCECLKTSRLVAAELSCGNRTTGQHSSHSLAPEWLKPTPMSPEETYQRGIKSVVISPGFAADCLETLEELAVENREYFIAAGGED